MFRPSSRPADIAVRLPFIPEVDLIVRVLDLLAFLARRDAGVFSLNYLPPSSRLQLGEKELSQLSSGERCTAPDVLPLSLPIEKQRMPS